MAIKIIADSCCDTTPELRRMLDITLIPLIIKVDGHEEIRDVIDTDTAGLVDSMASTKEPIRTSCPSVEDYAGYMRQHDACAVITLSDKLSGSYNAARLAEETVKQESPHKKIHVFDSQSASAGETLIALYVHDLDAQGEPFETVVKKTEAFISGMRTFFVLKDLSNLVKNGRMSRVKGILTSVLSIYPVLADNGAGEIVSRHVVRGLANAHNKLVEAIAEETEGRPKKSVRLTLSQCHCLDTAARIKSAILERCAAIRDVLILPTSGLSTAYANLGGIIVAF